jgi:hypothetical protein
MATPTDPTGQARNRDRATRKLQNRLTIAEREVKALFRAIPRTRRQQVILPNAETETIYAYDLPTTGAIALQIDIREAIDRALDVAGLVPPPGWWYEPLIELPYRQGTLEEIRDFNQLIAQAIAAGVTGVGGLPLLITDPADILLSPEYLQRLRVVVVRNYGLIKSLSSSTADQVIQQINLGIDAGETPSQIRKRITKRFDVSRSNAKRIADTEINRAYNDARLEAAKTAAERSGLRAGVLHISALIPTTRRVHAKRHSSAYTPDQQLKWWNSGSNRINCLCSTRSVLIDRGGKVVDQALQKEIKNQGDEFFEEQ